MHQCLRSGSAVCEGKADSICGKHPATAGNGRVCKTARRKERHASWSPCLRRRELPVKTLMVSPSGLRRSAPPAACERWLFPDKAVIGDLCGLDCLIFRNGSFAPRLVGTACLADMTCLECSGPEQDSLCPTAPWGKNSRIGSRCQRSLGEGSEQHCLCLTARMGPSGHSRHHLRHRLEASH